MHPLLLDLGSVHLGSLTIPLILPSYGVFFAAAIMVGWYVMWKLVPQKYPGAPATDLYFLGCIIPGVIGAKLANVLVFLPDLASGRRSLGSTLMGGGVWLGGVVLAFCVTVWLIRRHGIAPGIYTNAAFIAIPAGHATGRIGCFLGGCCYGSACDLPWAVTYTNPLTLRLHPELAEHVVARHPVQLYESGLEAINALICYALWRRDARPWSIVATWSGLYGVERFALEFLRSDPRGNYGPFSTSQWIAIGLIVCGGVLFVALWRRGTPVAGSRQTRRQAARALTRQH